MRRNGSQTILGPDGESAVDPGRCTPRGRAGRALGFPGAATVVLTAAVTAMVSVVGACGQPRPATCPTARCSVSERPPTRPARPMPRPAVGFLQHTSHALLRVGSYGPVSVALNPKGTLMAVGSRYGQVRIVRLVDGRVLRVLGHGDELRDGVLVDFSRDGNFLVTAGYELNRVRVWDPDLGTLKREFAVSMHRINKLAVSRGDRVLLAGDGGRIEGYEAGSGKRIGRIKTRYGLDVAALDATADGRWATAVDEGGDLEIYNLESWQRVGRATIGENLEAVQLTPSGDEVAVGLADGVVRFYHVPFADRVQGKTFRVAGRISELKFSRDGIRLAAGLEGGSVVVLDGRSGKELRRFKGDDKPIGGVVMGSDWVVAVERDVGVHVWFSSKAQFHLPRPQPLPRPAARDPLPALLRSVAVRTIFPVPFRINRIALDRHGYLVAATARPEQVAVWDALSGRLKWRSKKPPGHVSYQTYLARKAPPPVVVAFNPRNSRLYGFGRSNRIYRWHGVTGSPARYWLNAKGTLRGLIFAHDGRSFFALIEEGKVRHYQTDGTPLGSLTVKDRPYWIGVCPTGRRFVTVSGWDGLNMYEVASRKLKWRKESGSIDRYEILAIRFDAACRKLYTYHRTGFVRIHDVETGAILARKLMHFDHRSSTCSFFPGGDWLACSWGRRTTILPVGPGTWRAFLDVPVGMPGAVEGLAPSFDGNALAAVVGIQGLIVWQFGRRKGVPAAAKGHAAPRPVPTPGRRPGVSRGPRVAQPRLVFPRSHGLRRRSPGLSPVAPRKSGRRGPGPARPPAPRPR
ncbi:MAG: WD40 repeat domain-containing protein [Deltaproteobacteria bacterium]|nr:WD40 repeat domain-containing protein [Deltaproteobacteria bacterium]